MKQQKSEIVLMLKKYFTPNHFLDPDLAKPWSKLNLGFKNTDLVTKSNFNYKYNIHL